MGDALDGAYVANLIDHGPLGFARAEVATLGEVFDYVALASNPDAVARRGGIGGNLTAVASDAPIDQVLTPYPTRQGCD